MTLNETDITRRELIGSLAGAALGAGALAAGGLALAGCSSGASTSDIDVLTVAETDVVTLESFAEVKKPESSYEVSDVASFPIGTQLFSSDGVTAAALMTGETANPLSTVSLVSLKTGGEHAVLEQAVSSADGYQILDVACNSELMAWVECNYLTSEWRVYSASVSGSGIGKILQLDEGGADYDAPEIEVAASQAYWVVQPAADGAKTGEDSLLKTAGGSAISTVYTSPGRFNGQLFAQGDYLIAMPRVDSSSVYYQLSAFNGSSLAASQVMPRSFTPDTAMYMDGGFAFSIPAGYDYGGGIANVGTYCQMPSGTWLRLTRQPVTPPGLCEGWLFCKSGTRTVLVDRYDERYFTIDAPSGASTIGDYPVACGEVDAISVYSTVTSVKNSKSTTEVVLRRIEPVKIG